MARKFMISEEDFDLSNKVQKAETPNTTTETPATPAEKVETVLPAPEEAPAPAEKAELKPVVNNESNAIIVSEAADNDYVRVRVGKVEKKEAMSVKKMILIKPSVQQRIDYVLRTQLPGVSFNSVVNQLLEGWLDEATAIDSEK